MSNIQVGIIIQSCNRYMIKRMSQSPARLDRISQDKGYNQFQTFQIYPHELHSVESNKDSLLFSQSKKDDTNKQIVFSLNKQDWREYQLRSRGSSIKKNRINETAKDNQNMQSQPTNALYHYTITPFDVRHNFNKKDGIASNSNSQGFDGCSKCQRLEEQHKKEIAFLTKNNLELYELNKTLAEQLNQFAKKYEQLQRQNSKVKKECSSLSKENYVLREKKVQMEEKYYQREKKYMKEKEQNLRSHEKELKIVEKISSCLQQKEQRRSKEHFRQTTTQKDKEKEVIDKRSKTQYSYEGHNKHGSTTATWEGSNFNVKHTPTKAIEKPREIISADKLRIEIDSKVSKLSQQKKKILERVAKQNLTIEDLQTEIPQSALSKMGKGNVGKLTLAKSTLGKSSSLFSGSSMLGQRKCR